MIHMRIVKLNVVVFLFIFVKINAGAFVPQTHDLMDNCGSTIRFSDSVILKGMNLTDTSCTVAVQAANTYNGLLLDFNTLNLPHTCNDSSLKVVDIFGKIIAGPLCKGKLREKVFESEGSVASVQYTSGGTGTEDSSFSLIITSFNNGTDGKCKPAEFQCNNKLCIASDLVCNKVNECSDNSDETTPCEKHDNDELTLFYTILIAIGSAILLIAFCVCCCCCCKKTKFYTYVRIK